MISQTFVISVAGTIILIQLSIIGALIMIVFKNFVQKSALSETLILLNKSINDLNSSVNVVTEKFEGQKNICDERHNKSSKKK